jgi:hypothetical protein
MEWLTLPGDKMEIKIDDREIEIVSPDVAKPLVKISMGDQVVTIYDHKQLWQLAKAVDFLMENWDENA